MGPLRERKSRAKWSLLRPCPCCVENTTNPIISGTGRVLRLDEQVQTFRAVEIRSALALEGGGRRQEGSVPRS